LGASAEFATERRLIAGKWCGCAAGFKGHNQSACVAEPNGMASTGVSSKRGSGRPFALGAPHNLCKFAGQQYRDVPDCVLMIWLTMSWRVVGQTADHTRRTA
jgi:hypothetical protein